MMHVMSDDVKVCFDYHSPVGRLRLVADDDALLSAVFADDATAGGCGCACRGAVMAEAVRQLDAYFDGRLRAFDLPLRMCGSIFRQSVWEALQAIPYGTTATYGDVAGVVGRPGAARAVGGACHFNPFVIIVPCHRVVSVARGAWSGYAGGIDRKLWLLEWERRNST